jgi:predicted AAA+ superfamily ATPase
VLDVLRSATGTEGLFYWRDKSGREVDFVVRRGRTIHAVECKINPDRFDPESLRVFRGLYPQGRNYLICPGIEEPYERRFDKLILRIIGCQGLVRELGDDLGP